MKKIKFTRKIPSGAIIFNDRSEVLLSQRVSKNSDWHGKWQFPGGTIEFGEDPKDTAIRETMEEVGIKIKLLSQFPIVMNFKDDKRNEDFICIAYPAKYLKGNINTRKDPATSDAKWFKYENINFKKCLPFTEEMINIAKKFIE